MKNSLNNDTLKREIGYFSATTLVVANMVGTGIFTTSGFVIQELGSPLAMLLCWAAGGVFALCGALCYGELGARFPKAGGEYVFLRESFGPSMGFLSGWISLIVGFSAPIAAAAIAFSIYLFQALGIPPGKPAVFSIGNVQLFHMSPHVLVAMAMVIAISLLHFHSLRIGSRVQNVLTVFKVMLIVLFVGAGLLLGTGSTEHFTIPMEPVGGLAERFAVSLIFISFAYSGWNAAAYLGGEIKRPGRTIPFALFFGALFVTILYLLLNAVYIYALTPGQMGGAVDVGARAAISLFGPGISRAISAAVALGLLSVLSAMILTGPRVYYAMSKDGLFFGLFGKVSQTRHTPAHSIFLQAAIAIAMVATASYDKLLLYIGFTLSLVALLTVAGMIRLRLTQPLVGAGYRTFGYPITPLLFIIGNIWIIYFSVSRRPVPALAGLVTIAVGMGIYFLFETRRRKTRSGLSDVDSVSETIITKS
ncbi:MAG: amino acid permease [Desulfobacterales bacterium]|jgi:APA family basic amino acid/polyamine antiporter